MKKPLDPSPQSLKFPNLRNRLRPKVSRIKSRKVKTKDEEDRFRRLAAMDCCVGPVGCKGRISIHHCFTGSGGRKDHMKTIPLCLYGHHLGKKGIDGGVISKKQWQEIYGSEQELLEIVNARFGN